MIENLAYYILQLENNKMSIILFYLPLFFVDMLCGN